MKAIFLWLLTIFGSVFSIQAHVFLNVIRPTKQNKISAGGDEPHPYNSLSSAEQRRGGVYPRPNGLRFYFNRDNHGNI